MIAIARTAFETERLIQAAFEARARCLEAHRADAIRWEAEARAGAQGASGKQEVEPEVLLALEKDQEKVEADDTAKVNNSAKLRLVRSYSLMPSPAFRIEVRVWSSEEVPQTEARIGMMLDLGLPEFFQKEPEGSPATASTPSLSEILLTSTERAQAEAQSASPAPTRFPSQRLLAALARAQALTAAPTCAPPPSQLVLESLSRAQSEAEEVRNAQCHLRALLEGMKARCERLEKLMSKKNEDPKRLLYLYLDKTIKFAYPHLLSH